MSELLHGVHRATPARRERRRAVVEQILALFAAIPITEPIARIHAEVGAELASRGEPMPIHDLWIAATALSRGLTVATRNRRDFERVRGLQIIAAEP